MNKPSTVRHGKPQQERQSLPLTRHCETEGLTVGKGRGNLWSGKKTGQSLSCRLWCTHSRDCHAPTSLAMTERATDRSFTVRHGKLKQERQNAPKRVIARPKGWQCDEVVAIH